jgi:hypothetical protein
MFKKMLSTIFVVMLSGAALLSVSAQASPMLVQDFWGTKADGTTELFATLKVDVLDTVQISGDIYETYGWKSFTVYDQEILPANAYKSFRAEFDMSNLYGGFQFLTFDVLESVSKVSFQYFYDINLGSFYTVLDASYSNVFTDDNLTTKSSVVPAPASILLILTGFVALVRRRFR